VLVFRRGRPNRPARSIALPPGLALEDIALGRDATVYARDAERVYALTSAGHVGSSAPFPAGIPAAPLHVGADGVLYAALACGAKCAPFGGHVSWLPLTAPSGRLLSVAARGRRASPLEPLAAGVRLVRELSYTVARFALVDRSGSIVRAWRITSRTRLGSVRAAPAVVGGSNVVVPLDVSAGPRWEQLVLTLRATGGRHFTLAGRAVLGPNLVSPLRIGPDGRLLQLRASPAGASVAAYSLAG
jgi:hypothetical protein